MKRFTDAGRLATKEGNLYAALSLALTLPDICASLEDPKGKSKERYERWCKQWLEPKFTTPALGRFPEKIFVSAQDCYQLRCALLHSGSAEIPPEKQDVLTRFEIFDETAGGHLTWVEGNSINGVKEPSYLALKANLFSEEIFKAVDEWDAAKANDEAIKIEKKKLLRIRTKGEAIGPVKFG